jgi:hypothetical protein
VSGVTGIERLRKDVAILRDGLGREVGKELQGSIDQPIKRFRDAVDSAIARDFPRRYAAVFGGAFRIRASSTSGSAALRVKLRGTARGKSHIRDSAALNRGVLRHKTWGRPPWHSQSVRPGFWDDPAKQLAVDVRTEVEKAVERAAKAIEGQL